jgi:hypothetical protein
VTVRALGRPARTQVPGRVRWSSVALYTMPYARLGATPELTIAPELGLPLAVAFDRLTGPYAHRSPPAMPGAAARDEAA